MSVESELNRIEKIVRGKHHNEADRAQYLRDYERCEAALQSIMQRNMAIPRVLRLAAELAMKRQCWEEAVDRWERFASFVDDVDADSLMHFSAAYGNAGRLDESERALMLAKERGLNANLFRREEKRLRQQQRSSHERNLAQRASQAMRGETAEDAAELYSQILAERNISTAGREYLAPLVAALVQVARAAEPPVIKWWRKPRRLMQSIVHILSRENRDLVLQSPARVIFSCGFGFSGSGAVTDFLKGFDECELAFGRGELAWFKGNAAAGLTGAGELLEQANAPGGEFRWLIVNFFLTTLLGFQGLATFNAETGLSHRRLLHLQKKSEKAILNFHLTKEADLQKLATLASDLLEGLLSVTKPATIEKLFQGFFQRMIDLRLHSSQRCVFDNCIKAYELELLHLAPNAVAVVTRRDPRDQFVARAHESVGGAVCVRDFVRRFRQREMRYRMTLLNRRIRPAVHEVQFEEFVLDPASRDRLRERLGLQDYRDDGDGRGFQPEKSRQNIGIHKHWPNRGEIAYIEKKLRKYLVETAQ